MTKIFTNISGRVIHGDHVGRTLGFPTANIDRREYVRRKLKVRFGIWGGNAGVFGKSYKAAIVIGPLDRKGLPKLEAHLINFKGNLYGKKITIELVKFIRPFKKFSNAEQLKVQIAKDVAIIKKLTL